MTTIYRKIRQYMAFMESPEHPLLNPNLCGLAFLGILQRGQTLLNHAYNSIGVFCAILNVTQYVQLVLLVLRRGNFDDIVENLSLTLVCTMVIIKIGTFRMWHPHWCDIIDVVSDTEMHQARHSTPEDAKITRNYINYARKITYFYWFVSFTTIMTVITKPVLVYASSSELRAAIERGEMERQNVFSAWSPFDVSASPTMYWTEFILQTVLCLYLSGSMAVWDMFVVSLMVFFRGQLELLRNACERIAGDDMDDAEAHERIGRCSRHHVLIVKYAQLFGSMISPPMFLYFLICSVMFCVTALQITTQARSAVQLLMAVEYLAASIIELLLFYWHSEQVLDKSELVDRGVYGTWWVGRSASLRREMMLLTLQLRQQIVFNAGPINQMTMPSFTAILKAAYSYFALVNSKVGN